MTHLQETHPDPRGAAGRARFVTLCQQLLVLAVVATVLTPAARTISLDVQPADPHLRTGAGVALQAEESEVPTTPVEAEVEEVELTAKQGTKARAAGKSATVRKTGHGERVKSAPVDSDGYAAVGVTWDAGAEVDEAAIKLQVRSRDGGEWSDWTDMTYHDEHGPDPASPEGAAVRPGTDAVLVGDVDQVQVRVDTEGEAPEGLQLSVVNPGEPEETEEEEPAIDTASSTTTSTTSSAGELQLARGVTPKPKIYSRRQWGANEELRDRPSLSYHEVRMGFVHHTVNANGYSRRQVPGIIRGIYAYHVKSRGWSDIGYNFLVDRFGRIWEGRAGGVRRPVVGAHTRGYNDVSFAMSAIGNYETTRPSNAMIDAYGRLFAWKLSLHGVNPRKGRAYRENGQWFRAINGHRDAGATACPGKYLYARLNDIRRSAQKYQRGWGARELDSNLAGGPRPDIVMRRKSDGQGFVLVLRRFRDGTFTTGPLINTGLDFSNVRDVMRVGDWDRDGYDDLVTRPKRSGNLYLHRGKGTGKFGKGIVIAHGMRSIRRLVAAGDYDGDGWPDLIGKDKSRDATMLYRGKGVKGTSQKNRGLRVGNPWRLYHAVPRAPIPVGRWDSDGAPDVLYRNRNELHVYYGNGPGGYLNRRRVSFDISRFNALVPARNMGKGRHVDMIGRERGTGDLYVIPARYGNGGEFKTAPIPLGRNLSKFTMIR